MTHHPQFQAQRGLALVVSLVLLVISSLIAIATLSGSRLSERVAGNTQQKAIAFEAAESAVELGFQQPLLYAILPRSSTGTRKSEAISVDEITDNLAVDYDQTRDGFDGKTVDIDGELTIQFCGETTVPRGTSLNVNLDDPTRTVGTILDVNGIARVAGSATLADHLQRGYLPGPPTGRSGSCVTR